MSTYHSVGNTRDDIDVAFDMGGRDVRLSLTYEFETHLEPEEAAQLAKALDSAASQCWIRRGQ